MSDGTVLYGSGGTWYYKLTPDIHGSYVNGAWFQVASSTYNRKYYSSDLLTNGNIYAAGGEYGDGRNNAELGLIPSEAYPSAKQITVSPGNNVPIGTTIALNEAGTGSATLHYQWQTDGGGATLTNIPSTDVSNLMINSTGWLAGTYSYDAIVANSFGSAASVVAAVNVALPSGRTILVDFGATSAPGPTTGLPQFWNNITTGMGFTTAAGTNFGPGASVNLTNTLTAPTGIKVTVVRSFALQNQNGIAAGITNQFGDVYPGTATGDSLYGNTENFNGTSNVWPALNISGLDPSTLYTFKFYASRQSNDHRDTRYSLSGATNSFADLNPGQNGITNVAVVTMTPDAGGNILYQQTNSPANTQANHFTYLGVLQIDYAVKPTTSVLLSSSENPSVYGDSVTFTAAVQTNGITAGNATGNIIFKINNVPVNTNALVDGTAAITNSALPSGTNVITAVYVGDGQYLGSTNDLAGGQVVTGIPTTITSAPTASSLSYGQTLASCALSGGAASVAGSFSFTVPSIAPNAGATNVGVTFTPANPGYNPASTSVTVSVSKTTPSLALRVSTIIHGQTLASASLNGSVATNSFNDAPVPGSFAFVTPSVEPNAGATNASVTFMPTDTSDYNVATGTVTVQTVTKFLKIAIVGSSTAAGFNANPITNAWAWLYTAYLAALNSNNIVTNFAVSGFTTYNTLPTGAVDVRSNSYPIDPAHNITAALATRPDAVLINLPSNDALHGFSEAETATNYLIMAAVCQASNVPIWISTSQPRDLGTAGQNVLIDEKNWITSTFSNFPTSSMDFWTTYANADGSINAIYDSGDGVHPNNAGHYLLYTRVVGARIYELLTAPRTVSVQWESGAANIGFPTVTNLGYALQSSTNLIDWQTVTNISGNDSPASLSVTTTNAASFFRLRLIGAP